MTDYLGREIVVGDSIVYPTRRGSTMKLSQGHVIESSGVQKGKLRVRASTCTVVISPDRCVIIGRDEDR